MQLSVIIPTYNRVNTLYLVLRAIENQTLPKNRFEVIVVDDGSTGENRRILREYQTRFSFSLLEKEHGGLASARNLGATHATGDILYFLDDDVIPGRDTFREHLKFHENRIDQNVVVGSLLNPRDIQLNTFLWYLEKRGHYDLYRSNPKKYPDGKPPLPPLNGNSSIHRGLFFKIGGYDESFTQYGGEDLEIGYRLVQKGTRFTYHFPAVGYHLHVKNFTQFCMDMEKAGESLIWIYRKYPEIKVAKKIDILTDALFNLPGKKKIIKLILSLNLLCPWILIIPRVVVRICEPFYVLRRVLFPFYHWVSQYHYALGMIKGLTETK